MNSAMPANDSLVPNGIHLLVELQGGNAERLNDEPYLRHLIKKAVVQSGGTLLQINSHKFDPQGVTAFALLAESHISIHTWPELRYAAVDVFTCGVKMQPETCIEVIRHGISADIAKTTAVSRGLIETRDAEGVRQ